MEMQYTHCYTTGTVTSLWKCNMVHRSCYHGKRNMSQYVKVHWHLNPDDGGSISHRNVRIYLRIYRGSKPRRQLCYISVGRHAAMLVHKTLQPKETKYSYTQSWWTLAGNRRVNAAWMSEEWKRRINRKWETIRWGTKGDKRATVYSADMWSVRSGGRGAYLPRPRLRTSKAKCICWQEYNKMRKLILIKI
jgi:hypothetical protein